MNLELTVNGSSVVREIEPQELLLDFLRDRLDLKGAKASCEVQVCGACTVLLDGAAVRSCLLFAVQAEGAEVTTIEGLSPSDGSLSPVQEAFRQCHGLQCGFCTPGFVVSATAFLREHPHPTEVELREGLSGNLCRLLGSKDLHLAQSDAIGWNRDQLLQDGRATTGVVGVAAVSCRNGMAAQSQRRRGERRRAP